MGGTFSTNRKLLSGRLQLRGLFKHKSKTSVTNLAASMQENSRHMRGEIRSHIRTNIQKFKQQSEDLYKELNDFYKKRILDMESYIDDSYNLMEKMVITYDVGVVLTMARAEELEFMAKQFTATQPRQC